MHSCPYWLGLSTHINQKGGKHVPGMFGSLFDNAGASGAGPNATQQLYGYVWGNELVSLLGGLRNAKAVPSVA